jgi:hypothetical protein
MSARSGTVVRLCLVALAALIGGVLGAVFPVPDYFHPEPAASYPMPYHVPKYPGGVSLRLAMVHDVIHERFPRHGPAYYEERNRLATAETQAEEAEQAAGKKPSARYYGLLDDLGVGLERLGRHAEAVALMRRKLQKQQDQGLTGRDLYSSYANLGTFLILWQLDEGFDDKEHARERLREATAWVRKAVDVYPESHFGREQWQIAIHEYLLASLDDPELVVRFDMIGDRLDAEIDPGGRRRITGAYGGAGMNRQARERLHNPDEERQMPEESRTSIRQFIQTVGAEKGWKEAVPTAPQERAPFDEPALGIVGMWRYGAGANPHFALALGEIMLRVGQRYIAWCAYERAASMGGGVSKDPAVARRFVAHCRARQERIEKQLPPEEVEALRPRFEAELAFGQRYQAAYQEYEARRIREGASLDDPHFYDAFDAEHGPIASPPGPAEQYLAVNDQFAPDAPFGLMDAGLAALAAACLLRLIGWLRTARTAAAVGKRPVAP